MWRNLKFYLGILLMCVGCIIPMAIFNLPEEAVGGAGALVVFFAGGGLLGAIFSMYNEEYSANMDEYEERKMSVWSVIFSVVAVALNVLMHILYKDSSLFGIGNFLIDFSGNVGEFYLRLLTVIVSGLSLFPLFLMSVGQVDTAVYDWKRTTYIDGVEVKSEIVSHSCDESKVAYFFTTVLVATAGIVGCSLSVMILVLGLNIGSFIDGKLKKLPITLGVIIALVITAFGVVNVMGLDVTGADLAIKIACEILPMVFAGLTTLFFVWYFNAEFLGRVMPMIIAVFMMIFISWIASFGLGALISQIPVWLA